MEFAHLEEVRIINERFAALYGKRVEVDLPNFRLVFAPDQVEKRFGTHQVFSGDIYLRDETGIHELKKYPDNLWGDTPWIVERLIPNTHQDVMEGNYVYEPIYAFKIFPIWRACEFLIQSLFTPKQPKTEKAAQEEYDKVKAAETKQIREKLEALDSTPVSTGVPGGHAVFISSTKRMTNE